MDANDPIMIIFPFAMLSGVAHWNPSVPKPSVQHPHGSLGIHVARGACLVQMRAVPHKGSKLQPSKVGVVGTAGK